MTHRWNPNHGPDELYNKFTVIANKDGTTLGEDGEFIFTMRPERDYEAWLALHEYADEVEDRAPNLAAQLREKLREIASKQGGSYDR